MSIAAARRATLLAMARRIDTYLESLIGEDKFAFYEAVRDFGDGEIEEALIRMGCVLGIEEEPAE